MDSETLNLILVLVLLIAVSIIFVKISMRIRKFGGSMTTTLLASTYDFMNKDKREAAHQIVEQKSDKKIKEDLSGNSLDE